MNRRARLLLAAPAVLLLVALLVLPIGYLVRFSFYVAEMGQTPTGGFTLENYTELFGDTFYLGILFKTVWMSFLVTLLSLVTGYPLTYFMWRWVRRWRGLLTVIVLSPLLVSIVVSAYGWTVLLGTNGLVNHLLVASGIVAKPLKIMFTDFAIVLGLVHVTLPFMVLSILAALERIDPMLKEAAFTLGADRWNAFRLVVLPLSLPGIVSGTTLAFSVAVSTYVAPAVLGGSGPNFISTMIYHQFITLLNWPFGAAVAAVLLVTALGIVFAYLSLLSRFGGAALHGNMQAAR